MSIYKLKRIFLSHRGFDKEIAIDYKLTLEELGYEPWLDDDAMPAGTLLERGLLHGMQESDAVVFFITPSFKDEGYLATEIEYAIEEKRRKKDKFAIITLRLTGDGNDEATIPDLLRRYVWKTPKTPLEALREILKAFPIEPGLVERRNDVKAPFPKPIGKELSREAKSILREASLGDGLIASTRTNGCRSITINGSSIVPNQEPRTVARWVGGIEELERLGFIRALGYKREVFELTREGYEAADELIVPN